MQNDFSKGSIPRTIIRLAIPLIIAQLVNALYSIVDRIYIGHMPNVGQMALTGIGLCFPITMSITAFTYLIGNGGAPLSAILRGKKDMDGAEEVLGNSVTMLILLGTVIPLLCYALRQPILYLFGASDATYPYADAYIRIYLCGSLPVMLTMGLNPFINAQGFARQGMITVSIGAVLNLVLDPIFIFTLHMGIAGAAVATVISQTVSCVWVLSFLLGKRTQLHIRRKNLRLKAPVVKKITGLGTSGFIMAITESMTSAAFTSNAQLFGGDIYVTAVTVAASIGQMSFLVANGFAQGAQPVTSFNYGAKAYARVRECYRFLLIACFACTCIIWLLLQLFMPQIISIFNSDPELIAIGTPMLRIYFLCSFGSGLRCASQNSFIALDEPRKATFFALFRKVILLIPLIFILPRVGYGIVGIFAADPIADIVSAVSCTAVFLATTYRKLKQKELEQLAYPMNSEMHGSI